MDGLERRLVELNQLLLSISQGKPAPEEAIQNAQQVVAGGRPVINTGAGDDTVIINTTTEEHCNPCPPGPPGPQGEKGDPGVSVVNAEVIPIPGELIITLSDGTELNAGSVIGPPGPQGEKGDPGDCEIIDCDCLCNTKLISNNYQVVSEDYYIGVQSTGPITITLPPNCEDGSQFIIKAEMSPPLGNRKIKITTVDGSLIDGDFSYIINVAFHSVNLLHRGSAWHII